MAVLIQDYYTTRSSRHSWKQMIRIHSEKWFNCVVRVDRVLTLAVLYCTRDIPQHCQTVSHHKPEVLI